MRVPMSETVRMSSSWRRVAIVGAPGTGKSWLTHALTEVLRARGDMVHLGALSVTPPTRSESLHTGTTWLIVDSPLLWPPLSASAPADDVLKGRAASCAPPHPPWHDLTLVMGLDLPTAKEGSSGLDALARAHIDAGLRQTLLDAGQDFRVIYGQGLTRLNQTLVALGLPAQDPAAWPERETLQFALNAGRTPWSCEKCSDPDCEHRLFSRLLRRRPSDTGQS